MYGVTVPHRFTRILVPTPFRIGPVNATLIEADALALTDPGTNDPESLAALERELGARGHRLEDIDVLLLTHQHYDHVGLAEQVVERSGARVHGHSTLAGWMDAGDAGREADDAFAADLMLLHGVAAGTVAELRERVRTYRRYGSYPHVDVQLADGDTVDLGGVVLRAHHRPGHSPSDTLFVHEESGVAIVGDHLLPKISSNPVLHRPLDHAGGARSRPRTLVGYLDSMRDTAPLELTRCIPGHGGEFDDHRALIARRLREHEERKEQIHDELARGPLTAFEIGETFWPGLPVDQTFLAISEVLGHVDLLVAEGRAREDEVDGVVRISRA